MADLNRCKLIETFAVKNKDDLYLDEINRVEKSIGFLGCFGMNNRNFF